MALVRCSSLCRGLGVQRQALLGCRALLGGAARPCSGPGKELGSNITRREQQQQKGQDSGATYGRIGRAGLTDHKVNKLERYILVWGGKFKSLDEVPVFVSQDTIERARNKARIKVNLMMVAATLVGCLVMIYSGKMARDAGESVVKMNQDWHKKINEEYRKSIDKKEE